MVARSGRSILFLAPSGASEGVAPPGAHPASDMAEATLIMLLVLGPVHLQLTFKFVHYIIVGVSMVSDSTPAPF